VSRRCLLYAERYRKQRGLEGSQHTHRYPILGQVSQPVSPVRSDDVFSQVPLVTLGHRAGRSSAFWLAEAELLSASFRPSGLPSRSACCVALTLLSKRNFFEVISCAVKGRTPLRTQRATFTALRSSLSNARGRTRLFHRYLLAMHLPMTARMQQHPIGGLVTAAQRSLHDVVVVPPREFGDLLVTHRTEALLLLPQIQ
jgi:hypothetical protein